MILRASLLLAASLCGPVQAVRAEEPRPPPRVEQKQQGQPLSAEDAEVVRQLALLERVELLRNLDLFDPKPADTQQASQPPDAGTREP